MIYCFLKENTPNHKKIMNMNTNEHNKKAEQLDVHSTSNDNEKTDYQSGLKDQ